MLEVRVVAAGKKGQLGTHWRLVKANQLSQYVGKEEDEQEQEQKEKEQEEKEEKDK